jgi:hypothetical protein
VVLLIVAAAAAWFIRDWMTPEPLVYVTVPIEKLDIQQTVSSTGVLNAYKKSARQVRFKPISFSTEPNLNWCYCGLVALGEETLDFRMKSSRVKAEQIRKTGATTLVTACENCHTQLSNLNEHYKLSVDVQFLSSMVADALVKDETVDKKN